MTPEAKRINVGDRVELISGPYRGGKGLVVGVRAEILLIQSDKGASWLSHQTECRKIGNDGAAQESIYK